jgi:hypothetical protein
MRKSLLERIAMHFELERKAANPYPIKNQLCLACGQWKDHLRLDDIGFICCDCAERKAK